MAENFVPHNSIQKKNDWKNMVLLRKAHKKPKIACPELENMFGYHFFYRENWFSYKTT